MARLRGTTTRDWEHWESERGRIKEKTTSVSLSTDCWNRAASRRSSVILPKSPGVVLGTITCNQGSLIPWWCTLCFLKDLFSFESLCPPHPADRALRKIKPGPKTRCISVIVPSPWLPASLPLVWLAGQRRDVEAGGATRPSGSLLSAEDKGSSLLGMKVSA